MELAGEAEPVREQTTPLATAGGTRQRGRLCHGQLGLHGPKRGDARQRDADRAGPDAGAETNTSVTS